MTRLNWTSKVLCRGGARRGATAEELQPGGRGGEALEGYRGGQSGGAVRDGPLQSMYWAAVDGNVAQLIKLIGVHGGDPPTRSPASARVTPAPPCLPAATQSERLSLQPLVLLLLLLLSDGLLLFRSSQSSPLMYAAESGRHEAVDVLIRRRRRPRGDHWRKSLPLPPLPRSPCG